MSVLTIRNGRYWCPICRAAAANPTVIKDRHSSLVCLGTSHIIHDPNAEGQS